MPRQKKEYIEDSSIDTSENSESDSSSNSEVTETDSDSSQILESYNCDESDSSTEETINGRPLNKKKIVKKEYNDIRDVMFEHIDKEYAYGKLGDFEVIIMKKNGYVNATRVCDKCGKLFRKWMRNKVSKEIISEVTKLLNKNEYGTNVPDLIVKVLTGNNVTRGTYVHSDLINHIVYWCSPKYAVHMSKIVNEYHINQAMDKKDKLLKRKENKIDKMGKKIDKLLKKNDILLKDNEDFRRRDDIMSNKVDHLVDEIDIKLDNYVVEGNPSTRHILVIIKTNELPQKIKTKKGKFITTQPEYDYIALRVMEKSYRSRIKKITEKFPDMKILLEIKYTPNSMNLWNRIRKNMNGKKIAVSGSRFKRLIGYSERRMIREIQNIHDKRYNYNNK